MEMKEKLNSPLSVVNASATWLFFLISVGHKRRWWMANERVADT
jgi:hypothetical protein